MTEPRNPTNPTAVMFPGSNVAFSQSTLVRLRPVGLSPRVTARGEGSRAKRGGSAARAQARAGFDQVQVSDKKGLRYSELTSALVRTRAISELS